VAVKPSIRVIPKNRTITPWLVSAVVCGFLGVGIPWGVSAAAAGDASLIQVAAKEDPEARRMEMAERMGLDEGSVRELEQKIKDLEQAMAAEITDLRLNLADIQRKSGGSRSPGYLNPRPVRLNIRSDPQALGLYQRSQNLYLSKSVDEAQKGFADFLGRFPQDPLAPNARYWLAECHYDRRRFKDALVEFEKVPAQYPQSAKAPDALLKIAYTHNEMGDAASAMTALGHLLKKYPNSSASRMVKTGRTHFKK
jgi:tol-pal system protein YbgF